MLKFQLHMTGCWIRENYSEKLSDPNYIGIYRIKSEQRLDHCVGAAGETALKIEYLSVSHPSTLSLQLILAKQCPLSLSLHLLDTRQREAGHGCNICLPPSHMQKMNFSPRRACRAVARSRFLRRFRSGLTLSLLYFKNELSPSWNVLRTGHWAAVISIRRAIESSWRGSSGGRGGSVGGGRTRRRNGGAYPVCRGRNETKWRH